MYVPVMRSLSLFLILPIPQVAQTGLPGHLAQGQDARRECVQQDRSEAHV